MRILIVIILMLLTALAHGQTHTMPGSNVVPSGASLTINSGASITAAAGSTVTGFGAPNTSGSSILYGNGSGGFSNVTVGTGLSFTGGSLTATGGAGTPAGANTNIQFNDSSAFGGSSAFTWDKTLLIETVTGNVNSTVQRVTQNTSTNTAGAALFASKNSTHQATYGITGTGLTPNASIAADMGYIYTDAAAGFGIFANQATTGTILFAPGGLTERARFAVSGGFNVGATSDPGIGVINANVGFKAAGAAASGKILKGNGTNFVASTETYAAPGTTGNVMTSDGTNWTSAPAGLGGAYTTKGDVNYTILASDRVVALNTTLSTPRTWTLPLANSVPAGTIITVIDSVTGATSTNFLSVNKQGADTLTPSSSGLISMRSGACSAQFISDGAARWQYVSFYPGQNGTGAGQWLQIRASGEGFTIASWGLPTGMGSTGSFLQQSSGSSSAFSAYTMPTTVGGIGYTLRSDGTNMASYPQDMINSSTASQSPTTADVYLTGSNVAVTAGDFKAKGQYRCLFDMTKSAGTGAIVISLRVGTAGSTSDPAILTFTFGAGTSVADTGTFEIIATWRTVGSGTSAVMQGVCRAQKNAATTTGLWNNAGTDLVIVATTSSGFNSSTATNIGVSFNGSTAFAGTTTLVQASLLQ